MKYLNLALFTLLAFLILETSAYLSCYDEYRYTSGQVCWNGRCVRKDPYANQRRFRTQYGFDVAKKVESSDCDTSRDCQGLGGGYVCSKGTCRLLNRY